MMRNDPDIQLMLDFKKGDQRAFQHLFDKYKNRVINFCLRFCGDRSVAEELAQETFLRVYTAAPRYRPNARFSTWLFTIAANVCRNEIRRPVYREKIESMDPLPDMEKKTAVPEIAARPESTAPDGLYESLERHQLVQRAIRQLPDQQRLALLLRVNEEFSYREISVQIKRSENHVKTLIHRGRKRLKEILGDYFEKERNRSL